VNKWRQGLKDNWVRGSSRYKKIFVQGLISAAAHIGETELEDIGTKDTVE